MYFLRRSGNTTESIQSCGRWPSSAFVRIRTRISFRVPGIFIRTRSRCSISSSANSQLGPGRSMENMKSRELKRESSTSPAGGALSDRTYSFQAASIWSTSLKYFCARSLNWRWPILRFSPIHQYSTRNLCPLRLSGPLIRKCITAHESAY